MISSEDSIDKEEREDSSTSPGDIPGVRVEEEAR